MIYPDWKLIDWIRTGGVTPFHEDCLNPASIDLRWSGRWRMAAEGGFTGVHESNELTIEPGRLFLLDTLEYVIMPQDAAGMLMLKSSIGRQGLEHLHAGWFDPGFHGTATLEIVNTAPWSVRLEKGQRIVQLSLMAMSGRPDKSYAETGRYNGQSGPQEAMR
jgi:dCTP deaminase